ncbi:MAG: hypothetical protein WDM86_00035 [Rhizomicrobium sp.]
MLDAARTLRPRGLSRRIGRAVVGLAALWGATAAAGASQDAPPLSEIAEASRVELGSAGVLYLYTAYLRTRVLPNRDDVVSALVVIHGYPRDANRTLDAGASAARRAGHASDTVVVAPLFQVAAPADKRCRYSGNPAAQLGDVLWSCASWLDGGLATGGGTTSFQALDKVVAGLRERWPRLRTITVAGFSAGAQFVQRYVGFARPPAGVHLRYVVSDPGTWLYFDQHRPAPQGGWTDCDSASCRFAWRLVGASADCPRPNQWKYGTDGLPAVLGSSAREARARYAAADLAYLEGELDQGDGPGTYYGLLDKSCAAELQGPDRLRRGLAYAAYDGRFLSAGRPLTIVGGCAHDVTCVFPSKDARRALFPR